MQLFFRDGGKPFFSIMEDFTYTGKYINALKNNNEQ